jgi:hypothetical protein
MDEGEMKQLPPGFPEELPPGTSPAFLNYLLKDSVRYTGKSESDNTKDLAKAAMARRLYSVEEPLSVNSDPSLTPQISDVKERKVLEKLENGEKKNPDKVLLNETVPDKPTYTEQPREEEEAKDPLLDGSTEKDESPEDHEAEDDGNKTLCCLTIKFQPSNKPDWPPKFQIKDIVLAFIGCFAFAVDYGTDIRLLLFYYNEHRLTHLYLTAGFIIVPSFISGIISVIWYKMYYRRDVRNEYKHAKTLYYFRIALSFLQLGRLWR